MWYMYGMITDLYTSIYGKTLVYIKLLFKVLVPPTRRAYFDYTSFIFCKFSVYL